MTRGKIVSNKSSGAAKKKKTHKKITARKAPV
jgi:hypothetical protein